MEKSKKGVEPMNIIQEIKDKIPAGTVIPKPDNKADFIVKFWGLRAGEEALVYQISNHSNPDKPYEKGITISEWQRAYRQILFDSSMDRDWFERTLKSCAEEGDCNFTTIGGIFQRLGLVDYERGICISRIKGKIVH
ncbi:MAG: hypothetical protein AB9897_03390 [Anaerolineaceae bacterium]